MCRKLTMTVVCGVALLALGSASSAVEIETVPVGNPGNATDVTGYGSVSYTYNISTYEVTAGQYSEFLNAVAKTDTYGLYSTSMWTGSSGCKIQQNGSSGDYSYSVASDYASRPVDYVSFWDASRFANWLSNGQGGAGTTEYGTYTLTAANITNNTPTRNMGVQWAVTSEDEWYKAAYYDSASSVYYDYGTGTNSVPSNVLGTPTDPGNNATFYDNGYTIGDPYYRTEVGAHENSESPYGTFDQSGNVWEWNEAIISGSYRGLRGGSLYHSSNLLRASNRDYTDPTDESYYIGFRVSQVPEPATLSLLALGFAALVARQRRRD